MIAGGVGGPVSLILLPDLVNLGVVEVDMTVMGFMGFMGLVVYGVRGEEGVPPAENSEFSGIKGIATNLLCVVRGEDFTMNWVAAGGGSSQEPWWIP